VAGSLAGATHEVPTVPGRREPVLWGLVGNTPIIPLEPQDELASAGPALLLKAEWLNPGGSVKDRPAREILRSGLALGTLPERRLLDSSSGNTAVAYAMLGAAAGIGVTVCVPANASRARRNQLRLHGAELIETDPLEGSDGAIRRAQGIAGANPSRYWYADQYNNPANPRAHERTTGPEIWRATRGRITHLVAGVGTSGTLVGAGRFLKGRRPDIRLVAVQPEGPLHGLEGLKHLATAIVPGIYDPALVDETVFVATEAAEAKVRQLARERGLFVGWSTGAALVAAEAVLARANGGEPVVVAIAPDGGASYLADERRLLGEL
jgi:S-sulfo-L-cysteine synthase (O-acetyl-L-serine-dependent)